METEFREVLTCECGSSEHTIIFYWMEDEKCDYKECYCSVYLAKLPFFKRLVNGIKYIFGYRSVWGDFEEFILSSKDAYKVQKIATFLKKKKSK